MTKKSIFLILLLTAMFATTQAQMTVGGTHKPSHTLVVKGQVKIDTTATGSVTDSLLTIGADSVLHKLEISKIADGSQTRITAGSNITVTGSGTTATPYLVTATIPATTNTLTRSANTLTSTVNGTASSATAIGTVANFSSGNALSTTVNGVTGSAASIVNSMSSSLTQSGGLTIDVNGYTATAFIYGTTVSNVLGFSSSGTPVYQSASTVVSGATTHSLSLSANTLTSTVNGKAATSAAVSSVTNTSSANTLSTTVNGVAGSTVPIINTNTNALTQAGGLVTTVNGVAATTSIPTGTVSNVLGYNATGTPVYQPVSNIGASNIYNADGTLSSGRTVTMGSNSLSFTGAGQINLTTTNTQPMQITGPLNDNNVLIKLGRTSGTAATGQTALIGFNPNYIDGSYPISVGAEYVNGSSGQGAADFVIKSSAGGGATTKFVVQNGGNVGIGNTNPTYKLTVGGTLNATDRATFANGVGITGTLSATDFATFSNGVSIASSGQPSFSITTSTAAMGSVIPANANGNILYQATGTENHVFGGNVAPDADNSRSLGLSTARWATVYAANSVIQTSDGRLKTNISDLPYGLRTVMQMRPVTYNWKKDPAANKMVGFIAQEMEQLVPEAVERPKSAGEYYGMKYSELIPVLTRAIQEQQAQIENLRKELAASQNANTEINELTKKMTQLEALISSNQTSK